MAQRTINHFRVSPALMTDITALLFELPAKASRDILNRIEGGPEHCEPVFKIALAAPKPTRKKPTRKKPTRKKLTKRKVKNAIKKVARKNRGA